MKQTMNLVHPNKQKRADVPVSVASIDVKFFSALPIQLQINHAMKTSRPAQNRQFIPSLFQIAAQMEDFGPSPSAKPNFAGAAPEKVSTLSLTDRRTVEFHLEAPFSESVRLAADFTDWEKFPLDMIRSEDGVWYIVVPLPPGQYSYRFIVDGEWCDDPSSVLRLHNNPFGAANAVVEVA